MRRLFASFVLFGFLASACASTTPSIESTSADAAVASVAPEGTVVPETTTTIAPETTVPEPVLLSGRDALAANDGKPHVLWFWGAH